MKFVCRCSGTGSDSLINLMLLFNDSEIPINIEGSIPINKSDNLDLRLIGNGKFIELIDIFADE